MLAMVDDDTRDELMHGVEKQHFEAGAWLRRGAADKARVYWIASGEVQLLEPLPEGGHALVEELGAGEHFGEEELLDASYDCRAVSACDVLVVDLDRLRQSVDGDAAGSAYVADLLKRARFLEDVGPFVALDAMARFQLAAEVVERSLDADTLVVAQGAEAESMFVIQRGRCSVWRGEAVDAPREVLAELGPGDVFGELGLLHQRERSANVSCIEACVLLEVSAETLRSVLDRSIHVGSAFESLAASRAEARP